MPTLRSIKLTLLLWKIRLRSWWKEKYWKFLALSLCLVAYFFPPHLLKIGRHPPVGTYIALAGLLAAIVTLRKEPPLTEKACWVILFTLITVAEIKNLYVAEKEQAQTFSTIQGGLQSTKNGLDHTVIGLGKASNTLGTISGDITKASGENQKQFDAASVRSGKILEKTGSAAEMASEAVYNMTGGDSVPEINAIKNISQGTNPPKFPLVFVVHGKYALRNVSVAYQDHDYTQSVMHQPMTLEQFKGLWHFIPLDDGGTGTILPGGHILTTYIPAGKYGFSITTAGGTFDEEMTLTITSPGVLSEAYSVKKNGKVIIQVDDSGYLVKPPTPPK